MLSKMQKEDINKRIGESRERLEKLRELVKLPDDVNIENINIEDIPAVWLSLPNSNRENVILYFHGGGYISGSLRTHDDLVMRICRASKARALIINYRLAPEHPYPAALEDSVKAYKWLIETEKIAPQKIIIAGDSNGGGLTISTLMKIRDLGIKLPAAGVCLCPLTDSALTGESMKTKAQVDVFFTFYDYALSVESYVGEDDPKNPYISPLYGDLSGLPPLLIQVATADRIMDDGIRIAKKAEKAGVEVSLQVWDDMIHVFQAFAVWAPESQEAIEAIGEYMSKKFL